MFLKSWLNKMKGKGLPPSARKVMRMENTLLCRLDELSGKFDHLNRRLDELSGQHGYLDGKIQALSARNDLLFWFSQMREGEGLARTKRNFFEKLVPEEGLIRGTQLVMLNLLDFIDDVCTENGLTYFLSHSTLIGAVRHKGFIPWDDDTDVSMMREDFLKFKDIIKKQSRYRLVDYYEAGCRKEACGRFAKLVDTNLPLHVFVDIFAYDWENTNSDDEAVRKYYTTRTELSERIWQTAQRLGCAAESRPIEDPAIKSQIDAVFDEYVYPYPKEGTGIQWGVDLFWMKNIYCLKKEDIFPVKRMPFEANVLREDERGSGKKEKKREFCVPQNPEVLLSLYYGDIMEIPNRCYAYFHAKYFDFFGKEDIIDEYLKTMGCSDQKEQCV